MPEPEVTTTMREIGRDAESIIKLVHELDSTVSTDLLPRLSGLPAMIARSIQDALDAILETTRRIHGRSTIAGGAVVFHDLKPYGPPTLRGTQWFICRRCRFVTTDQSPTLLQGHNDCATMMAIRHAAEQDS